MMSHDLWRYLHVLGVGVMGAGLVGVFVADLRGRQAQDRRAAAEAAALVALFYDAVVVPGAVLLGVVGAIMVATVYGAATFTQPWLAAMIVLFGLEFVEGNTITRRAFQRAKRLAADTMTADTPKARRAWLPAFTHFLDLPILAVLIGLGVFRPMTWTPIRLSVAAALLAAVLLTWLVPRLFDQSYTSRSKS
jgi:hypothetical protein